MSDTADHAAAQTPIDMEIIECTRTTWDELHDRLAEAEARAELVRPLVAAAVEMWTMESAAGDYPDGDPEVQRARRQFRDQLFDLMDLHYDEIDWLVEEPTPADPEGQP